MWRQLASREEQEEAGLADAVGWVRACGQVKSLSSTAAEAASLVEEVLGKGCEMTASLEEHETSDRAPLSVDHVFGGGGTEDGAAPFVVLYAPLGSSAFQRAHATLSARSRNGDIVYAYRPLIRTVEGARRQTLQGYGVQLAIKNMEYKVLDDKAVEDLGGIGETGSLQDAIEGEDESEVGGFYFATLAKRRPELQPKLSDLRETVTAAEGDASSLKVWAMQDLGLQASQRVLSSKTPLSTLADICQNFPFTARSLSKLPVNRELASEVQHMQQTMYGQGFSAAFLNGLALPITDNDFFGLMQTIQREMHTVDALSLLDLPGKTRVMGEGHGEGYG